jgi:ABC-type transport system involved in cytochrome c biogenesis permease component
VEVVFWLAVLVVTGMGVGRASGAAAALSAFVVVIAVVLE